VHGDLVALHTARANVSPRAGDWAFLSYDEGDKGFSQVTYAWSWNEMGEGSSGVEDLCAMRGGGRGDQEDTNMWHTGTPSPTW
jgi:hypothetical protein